MNGTEQKPRKGTAKTVWPFLAVATALASPLLVYHGVILAGDDVLYARLASEMADGHPMFGINTHPYRLGFLVPLAVLYHAFGIHDWATIALPLLSSLSTVLLAAYAAGRLYGDTAGAWAALFCGFNPIVYRSGSMGLADVPAGFFYAAFVVGWVLIVARRVRHRRVWAAVAGMAAAQGSYNFVGAPWLRPLEGLQLGARLTGLSILRAAIEGYLFAVLPVVVAAAMARQSAPGDIGDGVRQHLLVAIVSPLMVLSHFSTSFSQWVPVNLDLRFGSPLVIPAGILVAGACVRLRGSPLSNAARSGAGLALAAGVGLLWLGWAQENRWSLVGAAATVVAGVSVLLAHRMPKLFLPTVLVVLLVAAWGLYRFQEYPGERALNAATRRQAQMVPWDPTLPILTDPLTAQVLPYLHNFENPPEVATW